METTELSAGTQVGHYRVIERIGAGGMGVVYRAYDEHLNRDVALKVLSQQMLANDTARRRFRREALSMSRLNHPNIATVYDFDTQDGIDLLVTEYVPGDSLDAIIGGKPLAETQILDLAGQLASGLEAAHEQKIIHRDLKPGNLRLTPAGRLKILDFGLAIYIDVTGESTTTLPLTASQEIVGTLPYMAPEQLRNELVDARTDIWAAGAILYEMSTGRRPFAGANVLQLITAIADQAPPPPRILNPQISPSLERIILKAMEKKPAFRYQSAGALRQDLQALSANEPVTGWKSVGQMPLRRDIAVLAAKAPLALLGGFVILVALAVFLAFKLAPDIFERKPPSVRHQPVVQDLFNAGRYEEAANVLETWRRADPQNKSAEYYQSRVKEIIQRLRAFDLSLKAKDYVGARAALDRLQELHKADPNMANRQAKLDEIFAPEFQDEFLGGLDGWVAPPTWSVKLGSLEVRGVGLGYIREKHYRDFSATFNLSFLNNRGAVWILRADSLSRYYLFQLTGPKGNPPNSFACFRFMSDRSEAILKPIAVGADLGRRGDQFNLTIKAAGNRIEHYISLVSEPTLEPILLGTVTDPMIQEGSIGFGVKDGEEFAVRALKIVPAGLP